MSATVALHDTLVLFDVDGTLVSSCPAHRPALEEGLRAAYDINPNWQAFEKSGMTDLHIAREFVRLAGLSAAVFEEGRSRYMANAAGVFAARVAAADIVLLHGVRESLSDLSSRCALLGLLTGNVEAIA